MPYESWLRWAVVAAMLLVPARVLADDASLRQALATPGVHAVMRHALAPGYSDPANFDLNDCSTQRNLDARGRAQARATGEKLHALGARFDEVRTSQWCRCRETADLLGLGTPVDAPELNSFFEDRSTAGAQTEALLDYLTGLAEGARVLLVTHQVNITALTGRGVGSGEVFLISVGEDGAVAVVGSILVDP